MPDDYFVPLSTLIPVTTHIPGLAALSGWQRLLTKIGVRDYRESWNDGYQMVRGQAVVDVDASLSVGGFELLFGAGSEGQLAVDFEISRTRKTLLETLAQVALDAGIAALPEVSIPDAMDLLAQDGLIDPESPLLLVDAPPSGFRITVRGLALRLRLPPSSAVLGRLVKNEQGEVVGVEAVEPERPVEVALPSCTLSIDSEDGIRLTLDGDQLLDLPPFIHKEIGRAHV